MKSEQNKSIGSFEREKRKELKKKFNKLRESYVKQNEHLYNLFLKPNDNVIKAIDRFLVTHPKLRQEQIGIKQLMFIIDKAQEQKEKVNKIRWVKELKNGIHR